MDIVFIQETCTHLAYISTWSVFYSVKKHIMYMNNPFPPAASLFLMLYCIIYFILYYILYSHTPFSSHQHHLSSLEKQQEALTTQYTSHSFASPFFGFWLKSESDVAWYGMVVWRHLARNNLEEKEEKSLSPHVAFLFAVDAKSENSFFSFHFPSLIEKAACCIHGMVWLYV